MALGFMRRHREWLKYMLLVVVLAFIILYIPAFTGSAASGPAEVVAKVGNEKITVADFQREWIRQRQMLSERGMDPAMMEQLGIREQILESLIDQKLIVQEARRLGLQADDEAVAHAIANIPAFQRNGRFLGAEEIRRQLQLQGRREDEFTESVREELMARRLQSLITDAVHVSDAEAEKEFRRRNERVKVEYVLVDASPFRAAASATDEEVAARFQSRRESYRIPERRVLGYALIDPAALQAEAQGQVTDADVDAFYRENERQFEQPEEACARHILVKVKSTPEAPGHAEEEARALAQKLLDQVKAGGDFGEIARKSSEDAGSASRGGDLDCFGPGRMVPEFDQAVFSMQAGQVSDLVRTQHGFHVIQVLSRKEAALRPLSEVREPIRQTLLSRKVQELAGQKSGQLAAALAGGDSLEKAAKAQGLTVQKSPPVGRDDRTPPLDSPELMSRAFLLRRGETHKEPFRTSRGWVFVSVLDVQPSRLPELAEVKDRVRADLVEAKARAQAQARALEVRARAQSEGLDKAAAALGLVRKETPTPVGRGESLSELGAAQQLEDAVFGLAPQTLSDPLPVPAGYAVVRVTEKTGFDPALFAQQKASIAASLEQQLKQRLFQSYVESARARFPVERRPAALRRVTS